MANLVRKPFRPLLQVVVVEGYESRRLETSRGSPRPRLYFLNRSSSVRRIHLKLRSSQWSRRDERTAGVSSEERGRESHPL